MLFAGCARQDPRYLNNSCDPVNFRFKINAQSFDSGAAGVRGAGNLVKPFDKLMVIAFNGNGLLEQSRIVSLDNFPTIELPDVYADKGLILHFVGGSSAVIEQIFNRLNNSSFSGKEQGEVIPKLGSFDEPVYWACVEIDMAKISLYEENGIRVYSHPGDIELLRSNAKISFDVTAVKTEAGHTVTFEGYKLFNYLDKGTVAPFNPVNNTFQEGAATEPIGEAYISDKADFTSIGEERIIYEKKISLEHENVFFVILKARFDNEIVYYKLGLLNSENKERLPILRNHHYQISIGKVYKKGYSTVEDAIKNPVSTEEALSTQLKDLPKISDGDHDFEVERTAFFFTEANRAFEFNFVYTDKSKSSIASGIAPAVTFFNEVDGEEAIQDVTVSSENNTNKINGTISAKTASQLPGLGGIYKAVIKIKIGNLNRFVQVFLSRKRPWRKQPALISHGYMRDNEVDIKLDIAEKAVDPALYPLKFRIETKFLNPIKNQNCYLEMDSNGRYYYVFTVLAPGTHELKFKRAIDNYTEDVYIHSDYFETASVTLPNNHGDNLKHYTGPLVFWDNSTEMPVPYVATLWAYPLTTRNNFRSFKDGEYVLDMLTTDLNKQIIFGATLPDGRSYRSDKRTANSLSGNNKIVLSPFETETNGLIMLGRETTTAIKGQDLTGEKGVVFTGSVLGRYTSQIPSDLPDLASIKIQLIRLPRQTV